MYICGRSRVFLVDARPPGPLPISYRLILALTLDGNSCASLRADAQLWYEEIQFMDEIDIEDNMSTQAMTYIGIHNMIKTIYDGLEIRNTHECKKWQHTPISPRLWLQSYVLESTLQ